MRDKDEEKKAAIYRGTNCNGEFYSVGGMWSTERN